MANGGGRNLGDRRDPYQAFNFVVEIEGLLVGGFTEVSGLEVKREVKTFREGGQNDFEHRLPGGIRYSDIVLKRGLSDSQDLWKWYKRGIDGKIERKNGSIILLNELRERIRQWDFFRAYPIEWKGPKFQALSNAVAFETLVLAHEGIRQE